MTTTLINVIVAAKTVLADGVAGFELQRENSQPLPAFTAGSHVDVMLPNDVIRQYSLWNDPCETHRYCLGVLNEAEGRGGSASMHGLKKGANLQISAPRNNFALDAGAQKSLLLAGGIGLRVGFKTK